MEVKEGSAGAAPLAEGIMPQGDKPVDLMSEAAATLHDIRSALNEGGILTNLESAVASIKDIAGKISRGEGTIGKLVNDESAYNELQGALKDIKGAASGLQDIVAKVNRGEGTLGKLIADDSVYTNVQAVAANLRDISDRLNRGEGTLGKLLSKDDQLYKDVSAAAASLKDVAAKIERGDGMLGKLVNDEGLYNDAKAAVGEVRAAVDDFRETTPIVSFTSLIFGAF
jgi:phospholipid/cholesterol/gamma-HCH transport system substrate-binding protein